MLKYIKSLARILKCYVRSLSIIKKNNNIYLLNTPEHGNLGDHAIALAIIEFLKDNYPQLNIIEITAMQYMRTKKILKHKILPENILAITGGGYLGDIWINEERRVREIIQTYNRNYIVIFPQTIAFENVAELNLSKSYYSNHPKLFILTRERNSYDLVIKEELVPKKQVYCCPDMVMYLKNYKAVCDRKDVLLCFRKDKELSVSSLFKQKLEEYLELDFEEKVNYTDTVIEKDINLNKRKKEVEKKLLEFSSAKLVITDRLHGMIFAAVTGTPCIAFDNSTRKVSGVYEWIKDLGYVFFCKSEGEIDEEIKKITWSILSGNIQSKYQRPDFARLKMIMDRCMEGEQ